MKQYTDIVQNLEHLAEEAGEVVRIKSKCIRFGLDDYHVKNHAINRVALANEIGHFIYIVFILLKHRTIDRKDIIIGIKQKYENMKEWYNFDRPTL
jgi:phosphoribosyl-ATP pyrophosphohydrolase